MRSQVRFFSSLSVLLITAGVGVFLLSSPTSDSDKAETERPIPSNAVSEATDYLPVSPDSDESEVRNASVKQASVISDSKPHLHSHNHSHDHNSPLSANPAADLKRLPIPMQQEIKELTARDEQNRTYEAIEVEPGIVAVTVSNGPRVVPVAVMNEDGTVSIHEY